MLETKITFVDKATETIARNAVAMDVALSSMAQDIEIIIKTGGKTPFRKGKLRGDTYHEKLAVMEYRVNVPVEYAAAQEVGTTRGHPIQHYTTPGTGKGFFKDAIDNTKAKELAYLAAGKSAAGMT